MKLLAIVLTLISVTCEASTNLFAEYAKAVGGDAEMAAIVGERFRQGKGVKMNLAISDQWHKLAAERGFAPAMNSYALSLQTATVLDKDALSQSVYWLEKAASLGNAAALHNLGRSWHYGVGRSVDVDKAIELYLKAVSAGSEISNLELSKAYLKRKGLGDDVASVRALSKIAEQNAEAADLLARHYLEGRGEAVSQKSAMKYFFMASGQGYAPSKFSLYMMYRDGNKKDIPKRDAYKLLAESAELEYRDAMEEYGIYLAENGGASEDYLLLFSKAGILGSSSAQFYLAYHLVNGVGVEADKRLGVSMMKYAAGNGSVDAKNWLKVSGNLD